MIISILGMELDSGLTRGLKMDIEKERRESKLAVVKSTLMVPSEEKVSMWRKRKPEGKKIVRRRKTIRRAEDDGI